MIDANIFESGLIETTGSSTVQQRRWWFLGFLGLIIILTLLIRSFYLQILRGSDFRVTAEGNRVAAIPIPAPRGIIYDLNGTQLVENIASTDIVISPAHLPNIENETILIERLPELLPVSANEVRSALSQARATMRTTQLLPAVDHNTLIAFEREQNNLPGIQSASNLVRKYLYGSDTAAVIGYTSPVTAPELEKRPDLASTDITGKTGLEAIYDVQLHGQHGARYQEVNAAGRTQKQIKELPPSPGSSLHLSLDIRLQTFITNLLQEKEIASAAIVALDPRSGAVRALVSHPSYDSNIFSQPSLNDNIQELITDERLLLFNKVVSGTYAPGSIIKPFIAAAALNEKIITPQTTFNSTGGLTIGVWRFPDWKAGGHGPTNVMKAIAESVNTFFYLITGGDESTRGLGVATTNKYLADFGWGKKTNIDLTGESSGFLPTPEWKEEFKKEQWYIGDTYHLAIGQGDALATPLQIAHSTAVIANGGTAYQPFLVRSLQQPGHDPEERASPKRQVSVSATNISVVAAGMRENVTNGSGIALSTLAAPLAGKTGTAQIGGTKDTHAWFTSFGPYENPELVLTVLIDRGGEGDKVAVPIAKEIWQWWLDAKAVTSL